MTELEYALRIVPNYCPKCRSTLAYPNEYPTALPVPAECVQSHCGWRGLAVWAMPVKETHERD